MRYVTVQPSAFIDNLHEGHEGYRLPYPFHVDEHGSVQRQDFWRGDPRRVVGFAEDLDDQRIDLWWQDAWKDPQRAVGMYVVTESADGGMATHLTAIESMTESGSE